MGLNKDCYNLVQQRDRNVFDLDSCDTKNFHHKHLVVKANRLCVEPYLELNSFQELPKFILIQFHKFVDLYLFSDCIF
jgi:hypothetical protein